MRPNTEIRVSMENRDGTDGLLLLFSSRLLAIDSLNSILDSFQGLCLFVDCMLLLMWWLNTWFFTLWLLLPPLLFVFDDFDFTRLLIAFLIWLFIDIAFFVLVFDVVVVVVVVFVSLCSLFSSIFVLVKHIIFELYYM